MSDTQTGFKDFKEGAQTEDKTITIVHVDEPHDVYGGRHTYDRNLLTTEPPTKGWLGNPYTVEQYGRDECIRMFAEAFEDRLRENYYTANATVALPGNRVACYCRQSGETEPACHLDVVKEKLEDGTAFAYAKYGHDIQLSPWQEEVAVDREVLL